MTQAQKIAKEKFKKAIAYRTKTGVSLKEAFAHIYGKKVGVIKKKVAPKKKAAPKKKIASKKVAAIKIIEKGESKSTKAKATYQQIRTKKGTYKGLKKVGGLPITKGDYLVSTWGYDQTNVDFFYVVKIAGSFVYIVPASQQVVELGDMQGKVIPKEAKLTATPIRRKIKKYTGGEYVKIDSISYAKKWDGKPVYYSSYA